jgi:hypothetical protein
MTNNIKETYIDLIHIVRTHGTKIPKRHGEYCKLIVFGEWSLLLDTWNNSLQAYNADKFFGSVGIDWGGFKCNETMTKFWMGHLFKYKFQ